MAACWNGQNWLGLGGINSSIQTIFNGIAALGVLPGGDLIAAGSFNLILGGTHVAIRWTGDHWAYLGSGLAGSPYCMTVLPGGQVIVAGTISQGGNHANIFRWDGASWTSLGTGLAGDVRCILPLSNGDLIAGGDFVVMGDNVPCNCIARWNWQHMVTCRWGRRRHADLGVGNGVRFRSAPASTAIFVAEGRSPQPVECRYSACRPLERSAWTPLGSGTYRPGKTGNAGLMTKLPNGDLAVGGELHSRRGHAVQQHRIMGRELAWLASLTKRLDSYVSRLQLRTLTALARSPANFATARSSAQSRCVFGIWTQGRFWRPLGHGLNSTVIYVMTHLTTADTPGGRAVRWRYRLVDQRRMDHSARAAPTTAFSLPIGPALGGKCDRRRWRLYERRRRCLHACCTLERCISWNRATKLMTASTAPLQALGQRQFPAELLRRRDPSTPRAQPRSSRSHGGTARPGSRWEVASMVPSRQSCPWTMGTCWLAVTLQLREASSATMWRVGTAPLGPRSALDSMAGSTTCSPCQMATSSRADASSVRETLRAARLHAGTAVPTGPQSAPPANLGVQQPWYN